MLLLAAAIIATAQTGPKYTWTTSQTVRATGYERVMKGPPHAFTVMRDNGRFCMELKRDIDGQLGTVLRTEIASADGVYTWIASNPKFVLQIPYVTAPEIAETTLPVRYSRSELRDASPELQRSLGKSIKPGGFDVVASRDCLVVSLSDSGSLVQSLWVDSDTGLSLRQVDKVGLDEVYERRLTSVDINDPLPDDSFDIPEGAVVLRGIVSPSILLSALQPKSSPQYEGDLTTVRKASAIDEGGWIKKVEAPGNYQYAGTSRSEVVPLPPADLSQSSYSNQPNQPLQFGGIPEGWTVPGQVVFSGGAIFFGFTDRSDGVPRNLPTQMSGMQNLDNGTPLDSPVPSTGYVGLDGSIHMPPPPPSGEADRAAPATPRMTNAPGASGLVKTDFFDPSTGDTISFLQLRNVSLMSQLKGLRLSLPMPLDTHRFEAMFSYTATKPSPLNIVQWHNGETDYALVATKLPISELQAMAERMP